MENSDFLSDLSNINFKMSDDTVLSKEEDKIIKNLEKERIKQEKERIKQEKNFEKERLKQEKLNNKTKKNNDESDEGTEIIGNEKRILLNKISQYKSLFIELKNFKLKKSPYDIEYLKSVIDEMDSIVNTSNVETFLLDSILSSIKLVEGASSLTRYDITGLSIILQGNLHFISLCKQLFLKYSVFSSVPLEYQLIMLVVTSSYVVSCKNKKSKEINAFLDQPIEYKGEI